MNCAICGCELPCQNQQLEKLLDLMIATNPIYVIPASGQCENCKKRTSATAAHKTYNEKGFLLPDSMNSMSSFHGKVNPDGTYRFSIHDCHTSIRLRGDLNTLEGVQEAVAKVETLEGALRRFRAFIELRYDLTDYRKL